MNRGRIYIFESREMKETIRERKYFNIYENIDYLFSTLIRFCYFVYLNFSNFEYFRKSRNERKGEEV